MISAFRSLSIATTTATLIVLSGCSEAPTASNNSTASPTASPAATSSHVETSGHNMSAGGKGQININSAILSELDKLEAKLGVPALSNKIQASRPYGKTDELVSKKVINQEQFDQ
ncbi:MAG TPA: helix-hairpin-helix domain-containing protein, partial [Kamptonema sp.]|nr:helix-hairpin-helix domain-containing protein [Kamptonema sp.]